jgi:hypothetical protein
MFFVPALPVRLEQENGDLHYAMVDATAEISVAHRSLVKSIKQYKKTHGYYVLTDTLGQTVQAEIILISLFLCNPIGEPWLQFYDVPLALVDQNMAEQLRLLLGYDSFLSNLKLSFDFPRKEVRVSAPIDFEILKARTTKHHLPSSIKEAETLIRMGSYTAALPMIVAGLEEVLVTKFDEINRSKLISYLLDQNWLSNKTKSDLKKVVDLRNHAVHGFGLVPIKKKQAQMALRTIIRIIESILPINT